MRCPKCSSQKLRVKLKHTQWTDEDALKDLRRCQLSKLTNKNGRLNWKWGRFNDYDQNDYSYDEVEKILCLCGFCSYDYKDFLPSDGFLW